MFIVSLRRGSCDMFIVSLRRGSCDMFIVSLRRGSCDMFIASLRRFSGALNLAVGLWCLKNKFNYMRDPRTVDLYLRRRFKCDSSAAAPPDVRKGFALPETVGI